MQRSRGNGRRSGRGVAVEDLDVEPIPVGADLHDYFGSGMDDRVSDQFADEQRCGLADSFLDAGCFAGGGDESAGDAC
jgi:hypothetical protein